MTDPNPIYTELLAETDATKPIEDDPKDSPAREDPR